MPRRRRGGVAPNPIHDEGEPTVLLPVRSRTRPRYEEGMNFAAVLRATQGRREDLPPPPAFEAPPADLAERARRALYEVADPEFPISLVDLGLVYDVAADETEGRVTVTLSFTATACPCMEFIRWDVRERLLEETGVRHVEIETTWDPPWTSGRISERGREILRRAGVST
ncbi:MAG: metal-sulfur cluster assembly factor [Gemmatimonadota bacterium]